MVEKVEVKFISLTDSVPFWWLSFVSDDDVFLGIAVVRGFDMEFAVMSAHRLGCNPGGHVLALLLPEGLAVSEEYVNRLLTKAEAEELDRLMGGCGLETVEV